MKTHYAWLREQVRKSLEFSGHKPLALQDKLREQQSSPTSPRKCGYFYLTQATDIETMSPGLFRGRYFCKLCIKNEPVMPREYNRFFLPTTNLELLKQNRRISQNSSPVAWAHILPDSKTLLVTWVSVTLKILHNNICQHLKDQHSSARAVFSKACVQTMGKKEALKWWPMDLSYAYAIV